MDEIKPIKEVRKEHIIHVLDAVGGDPEKAGRILEIPVSTLRRMMAELGISESGSGKD